MSENMNGVSAGNAANKTYANTKYKDTFFRYLFKEKATSCIVQGFLTVLFFLQ